MNRINALVISLMVLSVLSCAGGGQPQQSNDSISQPQVQQQNEPVPVKPVYWTGDGGSGMSLGILVPESEGINANLAYLPSMVQGILVTNISQYSAISVLDRVSLDRVIAETLDPTYEDNLDIVRLGHVAHVGYMMTGKIIRTSTGYTLQVNVIDTTPNARTIASYSENVTVAQLDDHTAIKTASRELLTQMGVQLTDRAITALGTASSRQSINYETTLARGYTADRNGNVVEALTYYYQAASFDSSMLEAANRASNISTSITSGNIGENVRNDIQWRNEWKKVLDEANTFFNNRSPYVIVYDTAIEQGSINYQSETIDLFFRVTVIPDDASFRVLSELRKGLIATGRQRDWGLGWPYSSGDILGVDKSRLDITVILKNNEGKQIASTQIRLNIEGYNLVDDRARKFGVNPGGDNYNYSRRGFTFSSVNANDITDTLTIQITSVNGINVLDPANSGYIGIRTGYVSRQ